MNIAQTRARALRWAEHDARVPFRDPRHGSSLTVNPIEDITGQPATFDGAFRARRFEWPTRKQRRPRKRIMIQIAPGCFINEKTAKTLKLRPIAEGRRYSFTEEVSDSPLNWETVRHTRPEPDPVPLPSYWLQGRKRRFPATYTGMPTWALPKRHPVASNDNRPSLRPVVRLENDGPSAEWLAERDVAGHATEYGQMGTRIERALLDEVSHSEDAANAVVTLRQVRELLRAVELKADTRKYKGVRNAGSMEVVCDLDIEDEGQLALIAAEKTRDSYAIKVEFNDAPSGGTPSITVSEQKGLRAAVRKSATVAAG